MSELLDDLAARRDEFKTHYLLVDAMEKRMMSGSQLEGIDLSVAHINTIKSGLIIHIYNIMEAMMSKAMDALGEAVGSTDPRDWKEATLREWVRENIVDKTVEGSEDTRVSRAYEYSSILLSQKKMGAQKFKKPSGSWNDKVIGQLFKRLDIKTNMPGDMWRRIKSMEEYGDKTPLEFISERRNAIAHGKVSFENGASTLSLQQIYMLGHVVLDYLEYTLQDVQNYIDKRIFCKTEAA